MRIVPTDPRAVRVDADGNVSLRPLQDFRDPRQVPPTPPRRLLPHTPSRWGQRAQGVPEFLRAMQNLVGE